MSRLAAHDSSDGREPIPIIAPRVDASAELARFAAETQYKDLTDAARRSVQFAIADTLAIAVAGAARGSGHDQLMRVIKSDGAGGEASIIGRNAKASASMAAFANGAAARAMNFDDGHDEGSTHPSAVVVPAVLAVAERIGGVDGETLIAAVAVGDEIICRLGRALARREGGLPLDRWFLTSVLGVFGATAACCRALGLDAAMTRNAFGIALFEAGGTLEAFSPSGQTAMVRGMVGGFAAKSAVLAALMAEAGVTGAPESLEGRFGLFPAFFDNRFDRDALLTGLRDDWALVDIGLKAWPTVRYASSYVDAARRIVTEHDVAAADIAEIRLHIAGYAATRCEPLERQRRPTNYNNAGHALPYLVAAMAARRSLTIADLSERLDDADVLALAQRVRPVHDPDYGGDNRLGPAKVAMTMRDGRTREAAIDFCFGDPRDPMNWAYLTTKIRGCLAFAARPLSASEQDELIALLADLPRLNDVRDLMRRLA